MTIREARSADAERLAELSGELGYPVETEDIRRRLERLSTKPDHAVFVAEAWPGLVVGWTHTAEHEILEIGRFCEILGLVVAAGQRGAGTGRLLVERVERWAAERGLKHVSVRSNVARPESHPFYERIGYIRTKTQHAYRKYLQR